MKALLALWVGIITLLFPLNSIVLAEDTLTGQSVPTFVMTNFVSHDNSYISSQEAIKFTELLQIELMGKTSYNWVDRERVEEALKELKLSALSLVDNASSLQIGKWLKADLLVKGDFFRFNDSKWALIVEVVDLAHADTVGQFSFFLERKTNKPLSFLSGDPSHAGELLEKQLREVIVHMKEQKTKIYIAPLFFQNKEPGGRLDFFENDLKKAFSDTENSNIRFIQFPRATESIQEAELTVTGLVESDPDSWEKLADYYVWGEYEEVESSGIPFDKVTVKATVTIWDGVSKPKQFSETGVVSELSSLLEKIVEKVTELSQEKTNRIPQTNIRSDIALDLTERARDIQELVLQIEHENYPNISDTWWKRRNYAIQLLSVASFFDPANEDVRTRLVVEAYRDDIDQLLKVRTNLFWRKWARSQAWKKHCDTFGCNYEHIHMPKLKWKKGLADNRLFYQNSAQYYLFSVFNLIEECEDHEKRFNSETSIPKSIPKGTVQLWKQMLADDLAKRLLQAAKTCPEKFKEQSGKYLLAVLRHSDDVDMQYKLVETLWDNAKRCTEIWYAKEEVEKKLLEIYAAKAETEKAKSLLAMLPQEDPREVTKKGNMTYITTKKHISEKYGWAAVEKKSSEKTPTPSQPNHRDDNNDTFTKTDINVEMNHNMVPSVNISDSSISSKEALIEPVSVEEVFWVQATTAIEFARGRIWMAVQGQKKNRQMDQASSILLHDFRLKRTLDLAKKIGEHSEVTSMLLDGETLWITLSADGVWAIDIRSMKILKYETKDGLTSNEMYCSAVFENKLFFAGGREQTASLCAFDKDAQEWIKYDLPKTSKNNNDGTYYHLTEMASNEKWLTFYSHSGGSGTHVLLFDVAQNKWSEVGKKLLFEEPGFCNFGKGNRLFVLGLDIDSHGLWITTSRGIALLNLETMEYEYKCLSTKKITSCFSDNQYIWIARVNTEFKQSSTEGDQDCRVLCFDKNSNKWLYDIKVPYEGKVDKMIKIEDVLWLGMSSHKNSLISISISENSQLKPGSNRSRSH